MAIDPMPAGRNAPCPCGSGRKYKQCCLALDAAAGRAGDPRDAQAERRRASVSHFNRGVSLHGRGRLAAAIASYREALALDPLLDVAYNNLGNALAALGRFDEATQNYRRALDRRPANIDARYNLAASLHSRGVLEDAARQYREVLVQQADHAQAHYNLGCALRDLGRLDEALASFRNVVALRPDLAEGHANLGQSLQTRGDLAAAIACYRTALQRSPGDAGTHNNLGNALDESGDPAAALASYRRALELDDTPEYRSNFARCLRHAGSIEFDPALRPLLIRAIDEAWTRPADLTAVACRAIEQGGDMQRDPLLRSMLVSAPVSDISLERALVEARRALLETAARATAAEAPAGDMLEFACAIARQCGINEYVWPVSADEHARAEALRERITDAIAADQAFPPVWLVAVGSYAPLVDLASTDALMSRAWPEAVRALLTEQIAEPLAERRDRENIARLTAIDDTVSVQVRAQYEENPYPRWTRSPSSTVVPSFNALLRQQFPFAAFAPLSDDARIDVLVAGCGTGQEALETARQFPLARVLAVDLSLASLAYARRKTRELGVGNIEYAQADILESATLARTFDVISSVGVLHHLRRPEAGLHALSSKLRPRGFMRLGLYSERARSDVVAARAHIASRGYGTTVDDIRRCRQDLAGRAEFAQLVKRRDFYTTSECRDLLFHLQEHRYTIPAVAALLADAGLRFIGFLLEPHVRRQYAERFPDDRSGTDLECWNAFEADHPETFRGMYRFWVQKPAADGARVSAV